MLSIFFRVRGKVPGINLIPAYLDLVDVLDFGEGFMFLFQGSSGGVHLGIGLEYAQTTPQR